MDLDKLVRLWPYILFLTVVIGIILLSKNRLE